MDEKSAGQMAVMTEAVQPFCEDKIIAAMTCSHSGTMSRTLISKLFFSGFGAGWKKSGLPNPVMIAVGQENVYAFDYRPKGFKFKIRKESARWPRRELMVETEPGGKMFRFTITPKSGEAIPLEVPVFMGGRELVDFFVESLKARG